MDRLAHSAEGSKPHRFWRWRYAGVLLGLLILAMVAWRMWTPAPVYTVVLQPDDPAVIARGRVIYSQHCASCHGVRGEGQPNWRERGLDGLLPAPPHDPSGHTWHHSDAQLFDITKLGLARIIQQPDYKTSMPVYEGVLSDEDIVAVLSWIKAQWPAEIREQHDQVNVRASER